MKLNRLEFRIEARIRSDSGLLHNSRLEEAALRAALPGNVALLDFFQGDSAVYLFVGTIGRLQAYRIGDVAGLIREIGVLRDALAGFQQTEATEKAFLRAAQNCFQRLLAVPLASFPPSLSRLWIVPDGVLHYLPFDALLTGPATTWRGRQTPFLLRRYAIGYAYSAQQFVQSKPARRAPEPYGGWGIRYDTRTLETIHAKTPITRQALALRDYGPLPQAREEVENAQKLLGGQAWLDEAADRRSFLQAAGQYRVCHLAMHAIVEELDPGRSRLVFTASDSMPGSNFLYASDLYTLPLQADLIVLSACNTAHGQLLPGEGVASIGRAFQFAGARAVLMTQWQTEDNAAHALVPAFFERLQQGEAKDLALQRVKLALLEQPAFSGLAAPAYWAGFVVSGSPMPIAPEPWTAAMSYWAVGLVLLSFLIVWGVLRTRRGWG